MSTEDQIREVYTELAGRAPAPGSVIAGLAGRTRAIRQRRLLVGAGGAVAAATGLGLLTLLRFPKDPSTVEALLAPVRGRGYPMPFTPTWLPDGFRLSERRVTTGALGPQRRVWRLNPPNEFPRIQLELSPHSVTPMPSSSPVDINGVSGFLDHLPYAASCIWEPFAGVQLRVAFANVPDGTDRGAQYAETALRVARSTQAGNVEYLRPTMSFGWLPESASWRRTFETFETANGRSESVFAYGTDSRPTLWVGTSNNLPDNVRLADAEKTTLRGRPAWYMPQPAQEQNPGPGGFVVELADGKWLFAGTNSTDGGVAITKADLARVVETIQIGQGV